MRIEESPRPAMRSDLDAMQGAVLAAIAQAKAQLIRWIVGMWLLQIALAAILLALTTGSARAETIENSPPSACYLAS